MTNLYSLAYEQVSNIDCPNCDREIDPRRLKLSSSSKDGADIESEYTCPECEANYGIESVDKETTIETTVIREDDEWKVRTAKGALELESHSAQDTVADLRRLQSCLQMVEFNKGQFEYFIKNTPDYADDDSFEGGTWQHPIFKSHLRSAIHNYLSSAYTFEQVFGTLRERLPSGERIETQFQEYHKNSRVIIGLRTYIQHEQLFPYTLSPDLDADEYKIQFTVDLEDIWVMESEVTECRPHGYKTPPEELYGNVEGDVIDLNKHIKQHFEEARRLVDVTNRFAHEELEDELEDYYEKAERLSKDLRGGEDEDD